MPTLNQMLLTAMAHHAQKPCLQISHRQRYKTISYRRFELTTFRFMRYFQQLGLTPGARLALVMDNSLEWLALYIAGLLSGVILVPLRKSLSPTLLRRVLKDADISVVVLQQPEHLHALMEDADLPSLTTMLLVEASDSETTIPAVTTLSTVIATTPQATLIEQATMKSIAQSLPSSSIAMLLYRMDEHGDLRGAIFSHQQLQQALTEITSWLTTDEDDLAFTIALWSEPFSLTISLYYFWQGVGNVLMERYETAVDNLRQSSPTLMVATPHTYERFHQGFIDWLARSPESTQEVFQWALAKGKAYRQAEADAEAELRHAYQRADATFFNQLRGAVGGRIRRFFSTGALLSYDIAEFFAVIGLPITNLYSLNSGISFPAIGLEESSQLMGVSGKILPDYEVRIADDHEVLVRGATIPQQYWKREPQPEQKGWLATGDVGHVDEDGHLYITGCKPNILLLSNGYRIITNTIEKALTANPFIAQAALVGEGKAYLSAMIMPDLRRLFNHFQHDGETVETTMHPRVKALFSTVVSEVNEQLDRWEKIREFRLFDQILTKETGELTASMRISRHVVEARYADKIEAMYPVTFQLEPKSVSQVTVEPERLRDLLAKETLLDAWMSDAGIEFLFELARAALIDPPSMVNICDTATAIAQMENEEKPLSTAIIVGDPTRIGRILPSSQIQLRHHDHIRRMRKVMVTLAKMVDGLVLGYVVDRYGYVRGVHRLNVPLEDYGSPLMGPQFRHHAAISHQCDAVVFYIPAGGRQVRVFAHGELVGRYANGDWFPDKISQIDRLVAEVATSKEVALPVLNRILRCAFHMSERNLGAIFLIGEAERILQNSDSSEIEAFAMLVSAELDSLSDRELINFAKQDGATVIDSRGQFRGCMVLLRPTAETTADIGPGKGARHSSAAKMSAETRCLAITVSQDGPITFYNEGRLVISL